MEEKLHRLLKGPSATIESECERLDRRRSQFDPLLPFALPESGHQYEKYQSYGDQTA
jgi:hypothetical protein